MYPTGGSGDLAVTIKEADGSEQNLHYWYRLMKKSRLAAPITEAQIRLAQGFLRELEPEVSDLHALQERYNALFLPEDGVHWLH